MTAPAGGGAPPARAGRMAVAAGLRGVELRPDSVVTVGSFDGVHRGHAAILARLVERGSRPPGRAVVLTFDPHPRSVLGESPVGLLTTLEERLMLLEAGGVDLAVVVPFTRELSRESAASFYERYIVRGTGVREVVVGSDHMFGRDREAGVETLRGLGREHGFAVTAVGDVLEDGERISSSGIRRFLLGGDAAAAGRWLGRSYSLAGTVRSGSGRGAGIGFPTANVAPEERDKIVPGRGVYLGTLEFGGTLRPAMINVGTRPTFGGDGPVVIEAHLPGWSGDLRGARVRVGFTEFLREERAFRDAGELSAQLSRDREACLGRLHGAV